MNLKHILITLSALLLFTSASQAGSIKHWNGSSWLPLGTGDSSIATDAELSAHNGNPTAHQTLIDSISAHTGDTTAAHASSAIGFTPTGSLTADTVAGALGELDGEKLSSTVKKDGSTLNAVSNLNVYGRMLNILPDGSLYGAPSPQTIYGGKFTDNLKFGINSQMAQAYTAMYYFGYSYEDPWNATLARINYGFEAAHNMGVKWVREQLATPKTHYNKLATWVADPSVSMVISEADGWEAVDRIVDLSQQYGMKLTLSLPIHLPTSSATYAQALNNYAIPYAQFIANRYKNYDNIWIETCNEIWAQAVPGWTDRNDVGGYYDSRWVTFHATLYDTIKAIAPNMRVIMSSGVLNNGRNYANSQFGQWNQLLTYDAGYGAGWADAGHTIRWVDKGDDFLAPHIYPADGDLQPGGGYYSNPAISQYEGGTADIDALIELVHQTRPDLVIQIGELAVSSGYMGVILTQGSATVSSAAGTYPEYLSLLTPGQTVYLPDENGNFTYAATVQSITNNTTFILTSPYPYVAPDADFFDPGTAMYVPQWDINNGNAIAQLLDYYKDNSNVAAVIAWGFWTDNRVYPNAPPFTVQPYRKAYGNPRHGLINASDRTLRAATPIITSNIAADRIKGVQDIIFRNGAAADLPRAASGVPLFATDTDKLYIAKGFGAAPVLINPTLATVAISGSYNDLSNKPSSYTLPPASNTVLGGVKVGSGLTITDGVLAATASGSVDDTAFGVGWDGATTTAPSKNTVWGALGTAASPQFEKLGVGGAAGSPVLTIFTSANTGAGSTDPSVALENDAGTNKARFAIIDYGSGHTPVYQGVHAGGTYAAPSATPSGYALNNIAGFGHTGSGFQTSAAANIQFIAQEAFSTAGTGTYTSFFSTGNGVTANSEKMRISANGLLGVNHTTPTAVVHVKGNTTPTGSTFAGSGLRDCTFGGTYTGPGGDVYDVKISSTGTPDQIQYRKNSGAYNTATNITGSAQTLEDGVTVTCTATTGHTLNDVFSITMPMVFRADNASGTALAVITNAGNVGIGTTAPTTKLSVSGGISGQTFAVNKSADATLTTEEVSNAIVSNFGATGLVTATLPAAAAGYHFIATVSAAYELRLDPNASDTIYLNDEALTAEDGEYISLGNTIGNQVVCYTAITGAGPAYDWFCRDIRGTATEQD